MKKTLLSSAMALLLSGSGSMAAQSNTATSSGNIGKCEVWDFPYTLYNNAGASQTVSSGVTVTVDQNRNIGAVNLAGTGALSMSGANGITLSGSGGDINCRWDIPAKGSFTVVNNDGNSNASIHRNIGTFFTAPYNGSYGWIRDSGWAASVSGAFLNGSINLIRNSDGAVSSIYYRNQAGSCGLLAPPAMAETWNDTFGTPLSAGGGLSYTIGTGYSNGSGCTNTTINATVGSSVVIFIN